MLYIEVPLWLRAAPAAGAPRHETRSVRRPFPLLLAIWTDLFAHVHEVVSGRLKSKVKSDPIWTDIRVAVTGFAWTTHKHGVGAACSTPRVVSRQRLIERAGRPDRNVVLVAALVGSILVATAIFRSPWALLPLGMLITVAALGPILIRKGARPENAELALSLILTIAMAVAAGMTGGTSSPIVFLLPIGVVMNGLRAGPTSVVLCSVVTLLVFLATCLARNASPILANPLPMLAIAAMQIGVTIASVVVVRAEIGHRLDSTVDPLTGLLNRHGLPSRFEELRQQALISAAPITLVLFDLDHFKNVNDLYGHDVGDRLLQDVADVIRRTLRTFELAYRIGGEEFLILLPGMAEWEGEHVAQELRSAIGALGMATGSGITASFGVSGEKGAGIDFERSYRLADQALYGAKRDGRDRVNVSGAPVPVA